MIWHHAGCRREGIKRIDALGDFGDAAVTVSKHTRNPTRIGQPSTHHARNLLANRAGFRHRRLTCVEVIEFHIVAEQRRGRRKTAGEIGNAVAIENIPLAVVLRMDQSIGRGYPSPKTISRRRDGLRAAVSMRHRGEIGLAKIFARLPATVERESRSSRAIAARRATEDASKWLATPSRAGDRVIGIILVEARDGAYRPIEKPNLG